MIIFISPSKTFTNEHVDGTTPIFKEKSDFLFNQVKQYTKDELKEKFVLSDKLVDEVYGYYHGENIPSAAVFRYGGVLYKALEPKSINFQDNKLFIFSGLYGLLNSHDKISKYRIDYTHRMLGNLYTYWKDDIHTYLLNQYKNEIFIDLTSKEFEVLIPNNKIRLDFKLKNKNISTVLLKQLRGFFAREIINQNLVSIDQIKNLNVEGFTYDSTLSSDHTYIFTK